MIRPVLSRGPQPLLRRRWVAIALSAGALALCAVVVVGLRPFVRSVWGSCFSRDCAYLPTSPAIGAVFILGLYVVLVGAAIWQLAHMRPRSEKAATSTGRGRSWSASLRARFGRERVALWLILALAAALRFGRIDISSFKWGEAISATLGSAVLTEGHINLIGVVSSQDVPQLPGYSYLLAPISMLTRDPAALAIYGALLSLFAVYLCALVGRRWFGLSVGLVAALLFAVGVWPVHCGSRVWQQCFLPPASLLFLDSVLLLALAQQPWALVLAALWTGVMTHLHILSPLYLFVLPVAMVFTWRRLRLHHLAAAGGVFAVLMSPYVLWEITPNVFFRDVRHMLETNAGSAPYFDLAPLRFLGDLAGAGGVEQLLAPNAEVFATAAGPWTSLTWIGAGLAAAGLATCLYRVAARRQMWPGYLLLVLTMLAPTALLWRHSVTIFAHYLYGDLPLLALLGAIACCAVCIPAGRVISHHASWKKVLGVGAFGLAAGAVALYSVSSIQTLSTLNQLVQRVDSDEYGVPAGYMWQAAQAAESAWHTAGSNNPIFVGGHHNDIAPLLYMLGGNTRWEVTAFDDCKQLPRADAPGTAVLLLWNAESPAADRLTDKGSAAQAKVVLPRPGPPDFGLYVVDASALTGAEISAEEASRNESCTGRV